MKDWIEIERLFHIVVQMKNDEASSFIEQIAREDPELANGIRTLLQLRAEAGEFLERPAFEMFVSLGRVDCASRRYTLSLT